MDSAKREHKSKIIKSKPENPQNDGIEIFWFTFCLYKKQD